MTLGFDEEVTAALTATVVAIVGGGGAVILAFLEALKRRLERMDRDPEQVPVKTQMGSASMPPNAEGHRVGPGMP